MSTVVRRDPSYSSAHEESDSFVILDDRNDQDSIEEYHVNVNTNSNSNVNREASLISQFEELHSTQYQHYEATKSNFELAEKCLAVKERKSQDRCKLKNDKDDLLQSNSKLQSNVLELSRKNFELEEQLSRLRKLMSFDEVDTESSVPMSSTDEFRQTQISQQQRDSRQKQLELEALQATVIDLRSQVDKACVAQADADERYTQCQLSNIKLRETIKNREEEMNELKQINQELMLRHERELRVAPGFPMIDSLQTKENKEVETREMLLEQNCKLEQELVSVYAKLQQATSEKRELEAQLEATRLSSMDAVRDLKEKLNDSKESYKELLKTIEQQDLLSTDEKSGSQKRTTSRGIPRNRNEGSILFDPDHSPPNEFV